MFLNIDNRVTTASTLGRWMLFRNNDYESHLKKLKSYDYDQDEESSTCESVNNELMNFSRYKDKIIRNLILSIF